uniref:Uncharacterized protein n=1 Tax=Quercus lobata TaxID=97700 RepID=A0A7N2R6R1_QUELO
MRILITKNSHHKKRRLVVIPNLLRRRLTCNQEFYYLGLNNTSATFVSATENSVPAITFLMAAIFGWIVLQEPLLKKYPARLSIASNAYLYSTDTNTNTQYILKAALLDSTNFACVSHNNTPIPPPFFACVD